ncbi:MAG: polysaccharide biosynthesis protein [Planctomycetota bacterium]|jgi:FlaA1/EpsC-like NDP-sugar epimerase
MRLFVRMRTRVVALLHLGLFLAAYFAAFAIRFDFAIPETYFALLLGTAPFVVIFKFVSFYAFGQYKSWLRYVSLDDIKRILAAVSVAELFVVAFDRFVVLAPGIPRSIFLLDWGITVALVSGLRIAVRMARESRWTLASRDKLTSVLIVGAGDAGEGLLRELRRRPELKYVAVGFLDDDPTKQARRIGGVPVLGRIDEAAALSKALDVREAIIAIPSASGPVMRSIVGKLREARLSFKTLPGVAEIVGGMIDPRQIHNVTIEELLGRAPVELDMEAIGKLLAGKVVAVTGAGGSIGSELARQVVGFGPSKVVLIDWSENNLFEIERELRGPNRKNGGTELVPCIADIGDRGRMERVFASTRPSVVFHAAAHKHVPMMEANPCEAVKNNILGTMAAAEVSIEHGVEEFVLISTDKAADPMSVMGMTKRVAELCVQALGRDRGAKLVAVRFGNVLGSSGSVVPIFREQIEKGGPVTVTHPEMVRYFMTIPEAVQLVLQATTIGEAGDILVLDMGEPVKIVDLARELIGLSGLREPDDITIEFTGVRPGEKLREALCGPGEELASSSHPKVRVARGASPDLKGLLPRVERLAEAAGRGDDRAVRRLLEEMTSSPGAAERAGAP